MNQLGSAWKCSKKRFIAFDRALKIAENSLIDLMKEIRNIKRETKKENQ